MEIENYKTKTGQTSISLLVETFPEAAEVALTQCIHYSAHLNTTDPEYTITYDFKYLDLGPEVKDYSKRFSTVKTMMKHQRARLLLHPLTMKFNERKWSTLGKFGFLGDFVTYFILLIFLSIFVVQFPDVTEFSTVQNFTDVLPEMNISGEVYTNHEEYSAFAKSVPLICSVILILYVFKEFFHMYIQRWRYFKDTSNYLRWIFYLSIISRPVIQVDDNRIPWAVAIFMCYTNMMLFLRRYRLFGTYISMYTEVIKTVIQVMVVFVFFVLGFALVFYILFKEQVKVIKNKV